MNKKIVPVIMLECTNNETTVLRTKKQRATINENEMETKKPDNIVPAI
jgi:hypothetical protein